jgi:hypothetical protein
MRRFIALTYQDSRIIGHIWLRLNMFSLLLCNFDVLHIGSAKDYVVEFLSRSRDRVIESTILGAERVDILQGNGRLLRIDFVKGANITDLAL